MRFRLPDFLSQWLTPAQRFLGLVGVALALAVVDRPLGAAALWVWAALLAVMAGKRLKLLYFLGLQLTIVGFALLSPFGRVLWAWGPLRITQGALEEGVVRALRLTGLVFASLAGIHPGLRLPGRLGAFWTEVLGLYARLLESRHRIRLGDWVGSLDRIFEEVLPTDGREGVVPVPPPQAGGVDGKPPRGVVGWAVVGALWGLSAALLVGFGGK